MCDAAAARRDARLPARLNNANDMAKFIRHVLPGILDQMQRQHHWSRTPRTVVHDKASYFVAPQSQRLAAPCAAALQDAGLTSWLGDADADCSWLAGRLGDVYPHETLISHIRFGLERRFPRRAPGETRTQLMHRMAKVEAHLNSTAFKTPAGGGLPSLARSLHDRCARLQQLQGERLRT